MQVQINVRFLNKFHYSSWWLCAVPYDKDTLLQCFRLWWKRFAVSYCFAAPLQIELKHRCFRDVTLKRKPEEYTLPELLDEVQDRFAFDPEKTVCWMLTTWKNGREIHNDSWFFCHDNSTSISSQQTKKRLKTSDPWSPCALELVALSWTCECKWTDRVRNFLWISS